MRCVLSALALVALLLAIAIFGGLAIRMRGAQTDSNATAAQQQEGGGSAQTVDTNHAATAASERTTPRNEATPKAKGHDPGQAVSVSPVRSAKAMNAVKAVKANVMKH